MIQRIDEEPGWEFIQIYGLTETSPIVWRTGGSAPATAARLMTRAM
jgi:hypothetical protein